MFGKCALQLAEIFRESLEHFMTAQEHLLTSPAPTAYMARRAARNANAVFQKSKALDNCVGFIDGIVLEIAHPGGSSMRERSC